MKEYSELRERIIFWSSMHQFFLTLLVYLVVQKYKLILNDYGKPSFAGFIFLQSSSAVVIFIQFLADTKPSKDTRIEDMR